MGVRAVAVEELHPAHLGAHRAELLPGAEGPVDHVAVAHPPQLGAHECAALAGLDVLELDDLEDRSVDVDVVAVSELIGGKHATGANLGQSVRSIPLRTEGRGSQPCSPTTTRPSIRPPKRPGR